MKFRPNLMDAGQLENTQNPNLLYNIYKSQKEPNFLQNIQSSADSLKESTQGLPKSLFDLLINKRMGFNVGDKGYLNLRFPESQKEFDEGTSEFGVDFTYDF